MPSKLDRLLQLMNLTELQLFETSMKNIRFLARYEEELRSLARARAKLRPLVNRSNYKLNADDDGEDIMH